MSLAKFQTALYAEFPELNQEIIKFVEDYIDAEKATYNKNKENKALQFGKYKGYTVKELSLTQKGKDYLQWLLAQTWLTEEKFPDVYNECKALGIKKKLVKKADLN